MTAGETIGSVPDNLQGVVITDCQDPNARARQQVRFKSLFGVAPTFVELGTDSPDLEAAGHLVDVLDANRTPASLPETPSVVLVNVAPRGDEIKQQDWENGTPFCYFETGQSTVVSTYAGRSLSLVKKLGLVDSVTLMDIPEVTASLVEDKILRTKEAGAINNTQFRSLEFLPLAARLLASGRELPGEERPIETDDSVKGLAWFVDNFGNVKTTTLPEEIGFDEASGEDRYGGVPSGQYGLLETVMLSRRLADVPSGEYALTVGSSGYAGDRWLELVKQGGSAAEDTGKKVGSRVLDNAWFHL